jgi:hypothetical protein
MSFLAGGDATAPPPLPQTPAAPPPPPMFSANAPRQKPRPKSMQTTFLGAEAGAPAGANPTNTGQKTLLG